MVYGKRLILLGSFLAVSASAAPTPSVPSVMKREVNPAPFLPAWEKCKTVPADFSKTDKQAWSIYGTSPDASYATRDCPFFVGDVSFEGTSMQNVVFATQLRGTTEENNQAESSQAACEAVEGSVYVLVNSALYLSAHNHGEWRRDKPVGQRCWLDAATKPPVAMKSKFRVLIKRSINEQPVKVSAQVKQIS